MWSLYREFCCTRSKHNMKNSMELIKLYNEGKLKPYVHKVYDLEDSRQALTDMMDRKIMGK